MAQSRTDPDNRCQVGMSTHGISLQLDGVLKLLVCYVRRSQDYSQIQHSQPRPLETGTTFQELAEKTGVPVKKLTRLLRHGMTDHLLQEPKPGHVKHTIATKALVLMPILATWAQMGMYEVGPAKMRVSFEQRHQHTIQILMMLADGRCSCQVARVRGAAAPVCTILSSGEKAVPLIQFAA
jgi:hypothetical protein